MRINCYLPCRWLVVALLLLSVSHNSTNGQNLNEQKSVVTFIFGDVHPIGADKKQLTDQSGKPIEVEMALGTGFFVGYPDSRGGPTYGFSYLVTAKHVLKDFDGSYLRKIKLRLNLVSPSGDKGFDLETEVPVSDAGGNVIWHHTDNEADDVAIFFLLPDQKNTTSGVSLSACLLVTQI